MPRINLQDFFRYYDENNPNQLEAIALLSKAMPDTLMQDKSAWVQKYREPIALPDPPAWPITKAQMATIMGCPPASLPDSLMDDYARCVETFEMDRHTQVYFLGQCGHESCGLRYPVEIHDGSNYEGRSDLGNVNPGDGVKYAGTGWIQVTGRYNHQRFADYIGDDRVMSEGKTYSSEKYPWTISGHWWMTNNMNDFCAVRRECNNHQIDEVGARVNGRMRPNGADDRITYTDRAYRTLIGV